MSLAKCFLRLSKRSCYSTFPTITGISRSWEKLPEREELKLPTPAQSPPRSLLPVHTPGYTDVIVTVYNTTMNMQQIVRYSAPYGEVSYKDLMASIHEDFDLPACWVQEAEGVVLRFGDFGRKKWVLNDQLGSYKTEEVVAIVISISEDLGCWGSGMDWDWEDKAGCCVGGVPWQKL